MCKTSVKTDISSKRDFSSKQYNWPAHGHSVVVTISVPSFPWENLMSSCFFFTSIRSRHNRFCRCENLLKTWQVKSLLHKHQGCHAWVWFTQPSSTQSLHLQALCDLITVFLTVWRTAMAFFFLNMKCWQCYEHQAIPSLDMLLIRKRPRRERI